MERALESIKHAIETSKISQRELAERTGISQPTLNRIITGQRPMKITELMMIAPAIGCTVVQLLDSPVAERVQCAARSTNGSNLEDMRRSLLHFMEISNYLDELGIAEG